MRKDGIRLAEIAIQAREVFVSQLLSFMNGDGAMAQNSKSTPSFGHWFLHIRKTLRLIGTLLFDPQVGFLRKVLFLVAVVAVVGVLLIPDFFVLAALPLLSPFLDIPAGLIDIAALSALMYGFLRIFPRDVVARHAEALYGPHPDITPHTHIKQVQP